MSSLMVSSGANLSLAFIGVWLLAALGGWWAGSAAYFFVASDRWLWKQLNHGRRALLCCVGALVAFFGIIFLPATLPSAHSAWCWHKSKALHREKIFSSLRALSKTQSGMNKDSMKSCNIPQEAVK